MPHCNRGNPYTESERERERVIIKLGRYKFRIGMLRYGIILLKVKKAELETKKYPEKESELHPFKSF